MREAAVFEERLAAAGLSPLRRARPTWLQVNLGRRCNQACRHCHVDASPARTEQMADATVQAVLELVARDPGIEQVDLTGGAPELHPRFRDLVRGARSLGRRVVDRCNLTVLLEPGQEDTPAFLAEQGVEVVASLPCYTAENVDAQRGEGVFARSIEALRRLNALGYGRSLRLALVYNPGGAFLPAPQAALEADYRRRLLEDHGIVFTELLTLTNMPIARFRRDLVRRGEEEAYLGLLAERFNPATVEGLMCRHLVSVSWDGRLYDCDFNQMLDLAHPGPERTVFEVDTLADWTARRIATAAHCLGCTAGAGSSCGGALA